MDTDRLRAELADLRAQLAAISEIVGLDRVSIGGAPAVEMETPLVDRVRALRSAAAAEADEADRLRAELMTTTTKRDTMEIRTLRLTADGAPAVMPICGFYRINGTTYVKTRDGVLVVDNTPEELAALWDAAAALGRRLTRLTGCGLN